MGLLMRLCMPCLACTLTYLSCCARLTPQNLCTGDTDWYDTHNSVHLNAVEELSSWTLCSIMAAWLQTPYSAVLYSHKSTPY